MISKLPSGFLLLFPHATLFPAQISAIWPKYLLPRRLKNKYSCPAPINSFKKRACNSAFALKSMGPGCWSTCWSICMARAAEASPPLRPFSTSWGTSPNPSGTLFFPSRQHADSREHCYLPYQPKSEKFPSPRQEGWTESQILHHSLQQRVCVLTGSAKRNPTGKGTVLPVPAAPLLETEAKLLALGNCELERTVVHVHW